MRLHIHCFVSGPNSLIDLAAEFRYQIFSKEMPLVYAQSSPIHLLLRSSKFTLGYFLLHLADLSTFQVLKAMLHGDASLFRDHPELMDSAVWVYFHSSLQKYNRMECWGPLKDAAQVLIICSSSSAFVHIGYDVKHEPVYASLPADPVATSHSKHLTSVL